MSPEYFLHHLTLSEALDYIKGQDRRSRQSWEQTRVLAIVFCKFFSGDTLDDWKFPWEESSMTEEEDSEEQRKFEELKQKCLLINQRNNGRRSSMGIR